jgi:hypothetical protein
MKRIVAFGAAVTALGAGSAALVQGAAAGGATAAQSQTGGLSVMPAALERTAQAGALEPLTVANRSKEPLTVTVTARPWVQSASGKVAPNRRSKLSGVTVDESSFTLAPGAEKQVTATVTSMPRGGYLYGAIEVVGLPADLSKRKGVVLGYRLVGSLRLLPAAPKTGLSVSNVKAVKGTAVLPVKNTGNTLDPVSGTVRVKGSRGTKNYTLEATKILPGKRVNIPLGTKLAKGSYTATVRLTQKNKTALKATKKFRIR